ncbi:UNVERIFIED_CONTAM: hypothetical protein RF648_19120 [Kocuria sp. CPCC 205274]|uniref:CopG family transcriptional regulator n=1 Tax=Herbiconiux daphne TaxID=2970914 RepID=A0ABT2H929_9MICO|nr:hypothetical protein [Herbiconiux daphne]MCS5736444.1 hypothetical protein [Herbiconiux daphne]
MAILKKNKKYEKAPRKEIKSTLAVRLTQDEIKKFNNYLEKTGLNKQDALRKIVLSVI